MYRLIGGRSPILDITTRQAEFLESTLNDGSGVIDQLFRVYVGMRYWHPLIEEIVSQIHKDGIKKLVAISMYPHYSAATTGSALSRLREIISGYPIKVSSITSWFDHPLYIDALGDVIKKGLKSFGITSELRTQNSELNIPVLFSAHNLPENLIKAGDPYVNQIQGTIGEIKKKLNIQWHLSYQSKSGPVKWLDPSTEEVIKRFAEMGYKRILLVPISFVSDHIETLFEIDVLYKNIAKRLGIVLKRTDSLNTNPLFIKALKDLVIKRVKEEGWI
jgi:ferrochelatase